MSHTMDEDGGHDEGTDPGLNPRRLPRHCAGPVIALRHQLGVRVKPLQLLEDELGQSLCTCIITN